MHASRRAICVLVLAMGAVSVSCGGGSDAVGPGGGGDVASVEVTPSADTVQVGATVTLQVTVHDAKGGVLTGRKVFWASEHTDIATVSDQGVVSGIAPGDVQIAASTGGKSDASTVTVLAPGVASVTIAPSSPSIVVGGSVQLSATTRDKDGNTLTGHTVTWASSDDKVATVSSSGLVTGIAQGAVTITATSDGVSGTTRVSVAPVPANAVIVSPNTATITIGQTTQLSAMVTDAQGNPLPGRSISWESNHTNIARVSSSGVVTGVAQGTATITATSDGKSGHATITVQAVPVASVDVEPSSANLNVGDTKQLTATPKDANGNALTGRTVTWSSSNDGVASVSGSGLVTAKAQGSAVISARSGGQTGFATINVASVAVASIDISPANPSVVIGDQITLTATPKDANGNALSGRSVEWFSNNESVATVSSNGATTAVLTAKAIGQATITATSEGKNGTTTVTVVQAPVASVTVAPDTATIQAGASTQLTATTKDANGNTLTGRTVTWSSSNPGAAVVDQNGKVTGVAPGTATITATSEGKSGTAQITVTSPPVGSVTVTPGSASIPVYRTVQLDAKTLDAAGHPLEGRMVTWSSSADQIATTSSSGLVTGIAAGSAVITALAEGQAGTANITVTPPAVATVTVDPPTATLLIGQSQQLTATELDEKGAPLTDRSVAWSTSDAKVVAVDGNGLITAVGPGTAVITATSENVKGTSTIVVIPIPVASVSVAPADTTVTAGDHVQLRVTLADAVGNLLSLEGRMIDWTTSDGHLASVDRTGRVSAKAPGMATITATSEGKSGSSALTIVKKER